jgi:tetratricopeptide (TPR) repeat protein
VVEYTFKHALTHDVAYNSLLTDRRKQLHGRTAQAIEELYVERLEDHLTELAHHFVRSGNVPKAVEYLGRTGERAAQQVAHSEAIGFFTRALELLQQLPDGTARDREELDLQMALSWSLFVVVGLGPPQRGSALIRARELCERSGENARLMEVLLALAHFRLVRREFELARELAERVLAMAQKAKALTMLAGAHYILGLFQFLTGQFPPARDHFERAVELFGGGSYRSYDNFFAQGAPQMVCTVLAVLGYPSAALSKADELLTVVRRSSDPSSIANALFPYLMERLTLRDTRMVAERADEMLSIAIEYGMEFYLNLAIFFRGWAMAAARGGDDGISDMRRSISDPMVGGFYLVMLVALAETCGKNGRAEEGLDLVAAALATAEETGSRTVEAELHRLKGELLMIKDPGSVVEAERCLRTAIDVARRQSAKLFELRATVSLARSMANQGRRDEARAMLTDIYDWFTEGFDTGDLKDAKVLLEELK